MQKFIHPPKRRKTSAFMIISLSIFILALLIISPAGAAVSSWDLSPENPVLGDTLRIKGSASPEEEIEVQVTFEKAVPVSEGEYEYILEGVKIPEGFKNRFTVQASEAKNLNVRVKMLIWVTKSSEASGNTATVTQSSVPPGTYQIKMDGDTRGGASTVTLKITAVQQIKADSDGDFSYSYNTKAVPPGDFEISVGGIKKKVTVQQGKIPTVPPAPSEKTEPETVEETGETEDTEDSLNPAQPPENGNETPVLEIETQEPKTEKNTGLSVDTAYMLGGMGAAVLILIMYSKRK
ncbi:hypothetical protein EO98_11635 [Methanosarcina sp. 2.H.T.1A.6]|uniref:hypothetical protein n=1 Tax=unclassified Methanosarcina TaxID=2644672 RepID=UPI000620FC41|nr:MULTISPECIES: hypothetical protein [unclassified Methanosarcina]KKG17782.1 hypothetical protein EO94_13705 [Methanosarcina sp. 2.H.T.1A.3]KKG19277.1 hypothetical protein EO98_11635 [Methanosarcina sp. 2.H.T.1A.6]KKG20810.1 hypothetical protein EO97_19710 [Methanosarcina sp. 2.H.T.1A.15]KKG25291.1 hypothetical protein EO96_13875 [Methanosarcina sp. 2.H.T.1A.8]